MEYQLLVALSHLGLAGNGASPHILAQLFNICEGTVENFTKRCILAIIESLENELVYWPNTQERANASLLAEGTTVFDKCVGFVDGTIFPFSAAPSKHKEDYWMRKMVYAVNSLIFFSPGEYI
ncbi:hypothetical protein PTTG_12613, partial [Puccinia triticina 1-1 BBBD Race 1]